jgi:hypothetical protein
MVRSPVRRPVKPGWWHKPRARRPGLRLELGLGHGTLLDATYEHYAAELAAIEAAYRDGPSSPLR